MDIPGILAVSRDSRVNCTIQYILRGEGKHTVESPGISPSPILQFITDTTALEHSPTNRSALSAYPVSQVVAVTVSVGYGTRTLG
jgi:hypothetical protein